MSHQLCLVPRPQMGLIWLTLAVLLFSAVGAQPASAQAVELIVHSFGSGTPPNDGDSPNDLLLGADGALYGTTMKGGEFGSGTVFRAAGSIVTILHSFGATPNDGSGPISLVQATDGTFYGVTSAGGTAKQGTVFKLSAGREDKAAYQYSILHSFGDHMISNDGLIPGNLVAGTDGNLYGTTAFGGKAGEGIVYKMSPSGAETILHAFADGSIANDGTVPIWLTRGSAKALYGVASGGAESIFKVTMTPVEGGGMGYSYSILHSFQFNTVTNNGLFPSYITMGVDGNLYGTKRYTGIDPPNMLPGGVLYKLTTDGIEIPLHKFKDGTVANDGFAPRRVVQDSDGKVYGITTEGGTAGDGTVFMYSNGTETILHSFGDGSVSSDGQSPASLILLKNGDLYGTTGGGGSAGHGTVFKLTISHAGPPR